MRFLYTVSINLLFFGYVYAARIDKWRKELDSAKTPRELQILRKKIQKKMYKLSADETETAYLFIEVINRKLVHKPYEDDFIRFAGSRYVPE